MNIPSTVVRTGALCACLIVAGGVLARASKAEPTPLRTPFDTLPMQLGTYSGVKAADLEPEIVEVLGVEEYLNRTYRGPSGLPVGFYVGYWASQRHGDAIHSPMNCLPGSGWQPVDTSRVALAGSVENADLNRVIVEKGGERLLVLYWYQSQGRVVASEYWSKIHMVLDAIRTNRTDAAMVRVVVPIPRNIPGAEALAEKEALAFVAELMPQIGNHLPA